MNSSKYYDTNTLLPTDLKEVDAIYLPKQTEFFFLVAQVRGLLPEEFTPCTFYSGGKHVIAESPHFVISLTDYTENFQPNRGYIKLSIDQVKFSDIPHNPSFYEWLHLSIAYGLFSKISMRYKTTRLEPPYEDKGVPPSTPENKEPKGISMKKITEFEASGTRVKLGIRFPNKPCVSTCDGGSWHSITYANNILGTSRQTADRLLQVHDEETLSELIGEIHINLGSGE